MNCGEAVQQALQDYAGREALMGNPLLRSGWFRRQRQGAPS